MKTVRDNLLTKSVEQNFAAGYFFQSREALNELGLAVSIDTCDADNLAFSYIKGNIFNGVVSVHLARYGHVFYFQNGVAQLEQYVTERSNKT